MALAMSLRLPSLLPRLFALALVLLLATTSITFAAGGETPAPTTAPPAAEPEAAAHLTVPDVRRQAYVFAKGILQDAGFAWRVQGRVKGYAVNLVVSQSPAAGTRVVDTGAPVVILTLKRNRDYAERGLPDNAAPYVGTEIVPATEAREPAASPSASPAQEPATKPAKPLGEPAAKPAAKPTPKPAPNVPAKTQPKAPQNTESAPAKSEPKAPADKPAAPKATIEPASAHEVRAPDFEVPGAPAEPQDEMPLVKRAQMLADRLENQPRRTKPLVKFWLYQHAWIVAGARFGWHGGEDALRIVIQVDRDLQERWGIGARSERTARSALAFVERRSGS